MGVKQLLKTGLLFTFALVVGFFSPARAAMSCKEVLLQSSVLPLSHNELIRRTLNILGIMHIPGHEKAELAQLIVDLQETNPSFKKTYHDELNGRDDMSMAEKTKILADFQGRFWSALSDVKTLERLRDRALDRELDNRGAPEFEGLRGRQRLEKISSNNGVRVLLQNGLDFTYKRYPKILRVLNDISFDYYRNAGEATSSIIGDGILSSRQLEKCCAHGGLNSQLSFNRDFLKSDDNIYFFVNISLSKSKDNFEFYSEYGSHGISADSDYLAENGWVSPFIMHNSELIEVAQSLPLLNQNFPVTKRITGGTKYQQGPYQPSEYESQALTQLHQLDFTVADFMTLFRAQVAKSLLPTESEIHQFLVEKNALNQTNAKEFARQILIDKKINEMRAANPEEYTKSILQQLGLSSSRGMELKVPVFLPKDQILSEW